MPRVVVLVIAIAVFGTCDSGEPPETLEAESRASSLGSGSPDGACKNQMEVVRSDETQEGAVREVDVDGDGTPDELRLHIDFDAPVGCQAFLVVVTASDTLVQPVWAVGAEGGLPQPSLYAFADLDSNGSFEILVNEASGASTQFVGAYGFRSGAMEPIRVPGSDNGLFPFGGSVGHIEAVDCVGRGVVVSQAVPAPARKTGGDDLYEVRRKIYSLSEGELVLRAPELHQVSIQELDRFSEFRVGPFANCTGP